MAIKPFFRKSVVQIVAIFFLFVGSSYAQSAADTINIVKNSWADNPWEIGFTGGISKFVKTTNPNPEAPYKRFNYWNAGTNVAFSLSVIKNLSPKLSAEMEWVNTKLSGTWNPNSGYPIPPLANAGGLGIPKPFETGINEIDLMLNANVINFFKPGRTNDKWNLFVRGGIGLVFLKDRSALYHFDQPKNVFEYAVLYGGGLSFKISQKLRLKIGAMMSRVSTDRLDGVREIKKDNVTGFYYYNIKERYVHPYIGLTYRFEKNQQTIVPTAPRSLNLEPMKYALNKPLPVPDTPIGNNLMFTKKKSIVGKVYNFYYGVGFGYDKYDLTDVAVSDIEMLAYDLVEYPLVNAIIKSHTDSRGSDAYNQKLSEKRGQAVIDYLVKLGIDRSRLLNRSVGESQPVNKCVDGVQCTEAEHAMNRRTEIIIVESEIKQEGVEQKSDISKEQKNDLNKERKNDISKDKTIGTSEPTGVFIQLGAFHTLQGVENVEKMLKGINNLPSASTVQENGFYKSRIIFKTREEALGFLPLLQKNGFPNACISPIKIK